MPAVSVTGGHALLAHFTCRPAGSERTWYLVPSAAGGRLFRRQGVRGFLDALAPWAGSAGIEPASAHVVSTVPPAHDIRWPPLRPAFAAPRRDGASLRFAFEVPFDLAIFRGHFPTVPIVPGALLAGWAAELGREHCGWQHGACCAPMLKFRRIVQPGLSFELRIEVSEERSSLDFHIRQGDATCALGTFNARRHDVA